MKKLLKVLLGIGILLTASSTGFSQEELKGSLTLSGAWAIYPTAVAWAEAFQQKYPGVKVDVTAGGAGKGAADAIAGMVDIGMVSREPDPSELKKDIQAVYILKDAVYPVISDKNFVTTELLKVGIKRETLKGIYINGTITSWNQIVPSKNAKPIHVYTRSDSAGAASSWAAYLGKKQEDLKGVGVFGDPGLLEATKRDPIGIGYNNFSYVFNRDGSLNPGIYLLPIDVNENGKADSNEIFHTRAEAVAAIETGQYPAARKNYFFIKNNVNPLAKEFIKFALSDEGSGIVNKVGASLPLKKDEIEQVLSNLK